MNDLFDSPADFDGTNSIKWGFHVDKGALQEWSGATFALGDDQVLPMWVADMDFRAADPIRRALEKRAASGVFGYAAKTHSYDDAIIGWMQRRHGWSVHADWIVPTLGVVPGIYLLIKRFTQAGDKILIQRPVYHPFTGAALKNNRIPVSNSLTFDGERYHIDFDDLEEKASDPLVKMALLCSPHNPVGRVWTEQEIQRYVAICQRHNVLVVADEIHADLILPGNRFFTTGNLAPELRKNLIVCTAPSKTFNVAGLMTANLIIENDELRKALQSEIGASGLDIMNPFGIVATEAAYRDGDTWLEEAVSYIHANVLHFKAYVAEHLSALKLIDSQATYLGWLDFRALNLEQKQLVAMLKEEAKLYLSSGTDFGEEGYGFMRINFACNREVVDKSLTRLHALIEKLS